MVRAVLDVCIPGTTSPPTDEKSEASPAPGPLADSGPTDMTSALEDSLSQEVQDSFSFLEDSSSSEPEWVGVEDREVAKAGAAGAAFSPGEDDPGMGYMEELLGVGPQVRRNHAGVGDGLEFRGWTGLPGPEPQCYAYRWRNSLWSHPWMTCLWMRHSMSWLPAAVPSILLAPGLNWRRKMGRKSF